MLTMMQIVGNEHCFQVYDITGSAVERKDLAQLILFPS